MFNVLLFYLLLPPKNIKALKLELSKPRISITLTRLERSRSGVGFFVSGLFAVPDNLECPTSFLFPILVKKLVSYAKNISKCATVLIIQ